MSVTSNVLLSVTGGTSVAKTVTQTGSGFISINETIADEASDALVAFALDVSQCKSLIILADQALTIKTNSDSAPDDTIVLAANEPYIWHATTTTIEGANPFTAIGTDVTALYVTNASGSDATLRIEACVDVTV